METTAPRDAGGEARAWPDSTTPGTLAWAETPYMVVHGLDDAWAVQKSHGALRGSQRPSWGFSEVLRRTRPITYAQQRDSLIASDLSRKGE
jgi:hypothetical protein